MDIFHPETGCSELRIKDEPFGNPAVYFDFKTPPTNEQITLDGHGFKLSSKDDWYATGKIKDENCDLIPPQRGKQPYTVVGVLDGEHWLFDPRYQVRTNTLESPMSDGGGRVYRQTKLAENEIEEKADNRYQAECSNARMSFLNEKYCRLSYDSRACSPSDPPDVYIELVADTFEKMFEATKGQGWKTRYVYAVQGLRQDKSDIPYDSPCTPGETSRWIPVDDCTHTLGSVTVQGGTVTAFQKLLSESDDVNPYLRDVAFPSTGISCHRNDQEKFDFKIEVGGQCWQNVHQLHLQVFDFSAFVRQHDGGSSKITQFADLGGNGKFTLTYPDWHSMDRFYGWSEEFRIELGRYGDSIRFSELPSILQQDDIAAELGAVSVLQSTGATVVCGSPGEIANRPRNAGERFQGAYEAANGVRATKRTNEQRLEIWLAIALEGEDALRQRVAWALSQILVISPDSLQKSEIATEAWLVSQNLFSSF